MIILFTISSFLGMFIYDLYISEIEFEDIWCSYCENGLCVEKDNKVTCLCYGGWVGRYCEGELRIANYNDLDNNAAMYTLLV